MRPHPLTMLVLTPKEAAALVFTGSRRDDLYRIEVAGRAVWLPCASMGIVVDLVIAGIQTESGLIPCCKTAICRLRQALDEQLGAGAGQRWIETGGGQEYRLAIPKSKIGEQVGVTACFFELVGLRMVSEKDAETLRKTCRPCTLLE